MRYFTLLTLLTLSLSTIQAQWFRLGVSGEYNNGRVYFNPDRAKDNRPLYGGGFLLQYRYDAWDIVVEAGMSYKMKGWLAPQKSLFNLEPKTEVTLEYIEVPLRTYMFFGKTKYADFFVNLGNFVGFGFNHDTRVDSMMQRLSYGWEGYVGLVLKTNFGNLQLKAGGLFHFSNFLKKEHKAISSLSRYAASSLQVVYFSPIFFNFNNHKRTKQRHERERPRFGPDFPVYSEKEKQRIRERKRLKNFSSQTTYEHPKKRKKRSVSAVSGRANQNPKNAKVAASATSGRANRKVKNAKAAASATSAAGRKKAKPSKANTKSAPKRNAPNTKHPNT